MRKTLFAGFVLYCLFGVGCSKEETPTTPSAPTPTLTPVLTITGSQELVGKGKTMQLAASYKTSAGISQDQTNAANWNSSNTFVAQVSKTGLVTSVGYGQADISAEFNGASARVAVKISQPPPLTFTVESEGANVPNSNLGSAVFKKNGVAFAGRAPNVTASLWSGRGFNFVIIDPLNGEMIGSIARFDTYLSRSVGTDISAMSAFVNGLPNGVIILIGVEDEAGLTSDNISCLPNPVPGSVCCRPLGFSWTENLQRLFESLGATQLRRYCYRNSYAFIVVKGEGAKSEQLVNATQAIASYTLTLP